MKDLAKLRFRTDIYCPHDKLVSESTIKGAHGKTTLEWLRRGWIHYRFS